MESVLTSPVIQTVLWVLFWAFLVVFISWKFGDMINQLLGRVERAKWKETSIEFTNLTGNKGEPEAQAPSSEAESGLNRIPDQSVAKNSIINDDAHEFWLGHDLMWTQDAALRAGPTAMLVHGFKQAAYHASKLGLVEQASMSIQLSEQLKSLVRDLTATERGIFVERLGNLIKSSADEVVKRLLKDHKGAKKSG